METVTLDRLLGLMGGDLRLVQYDDGAGQAAAEDTEISWAHVSELADPTPWLSGGELLLTTGLQLFATKDETLLYCRRLSDRRVAALGVSTGAALSHERLPEFLPAAAAQAGLPLLEIAERAPLESVVRAVAGAVSADREQSLTRTSRTQHLLTRAAAHPDGRLRLLAAFGRATGAHSALFDPRGRLLEMSPGCSSELLGELERAVTKTSAHGPLSAGSFLTAEAGIQVHTVTGRDTVTGVLGLYRKPPLTDSDRVLVGTLVSLLAVSLLADHRLEDRMRRIQERTLGELLHAGLNARQAAVRMRRLGLRDSQLQVLYAIHSTESPVSPALLARQLESLWDEVITAAEPRAVLALVVGPSHDATTEPQIQAPGWHIGISHHVAQGDVLTGLHQARFACHEAQARHTPLLRIDDLGGLTELLCRTDTAARAAFAESVLAPLEAHDAAGPRVVLLPTLRILFANNLSLELTANAMGLHRHTVRQRLRRITEITRRDPARPRDRLELQLALEIRDLFS